MFKNLTNFSYTRSKKEAVGFYIFWLIITVLASGAAALVLTVLLGLTTFNSGFAEGVRVGTIVATLLSTVLTVMIYRAKGMLGSPQSIILIIVTMALAAVGGGLLGILIPSYVTTKSATSDVEPYYKGSKKVSSTL